jgi:DNA-binding PadR family transcriptional regulator
MKSFKGPARALSFQAVAVLHAIASGVRYGFEIIDRTGLTSGTVYTSLGRLERDGYVRSRWEEARTAHQEKRPPRRYYAVTAEGERVLNDTLSRYRALKPVRAAAAPAHS